MQVVDNVSKNLYQFSWYARMGMTEKFNSKFNICTMG